MDYIQEFVTLATRLSFSRASEDLFITQPSLSRHVSLLEAELGVKLVERNTRNVYLTEAGSQLFDDFTTLLDAYQTVQDHAKALASGYRGQFRISAPYFWIGKYVEPAVFSFSQLHPDVKIDMNVCGPDKGVELLEKNKADIALGFASDAARNDLLSKKIGEEQLCIVMPKDHPCAKKEQVSLRDFPQDKIVLLDMDESHIRQRDAVQRIIGNFGVSPSRFIFTQNLSTVGLTIRYTGGVSILMECFGSMDRDYLVSVPLSDPGFVLPLYLLRRKDSHNEAARSFFDAAQSTE